METDAGKTVLPRVATLSLRVSTLLVAGADATAVFAGGSLAATGFTVAVVPLESTLPRITITTSSSTTPPATPPRISGSLEKVSLAEGEAALTGATYVFCGNGSKNRLGPAAAQAQRSPPAWESAGD